MLNQVYNILFGGNANEEEEETMQTLHRFKDNGSDDDNTDNLKGDVRPEDVDVIRRKRGRPPKHSTSSTPASNRKQTDIRKGYSSDNSSKSHKSSSDGSDLSESDSDNDSTYHKGQKSRKNSPLRKKQRSTHSQSTNGTFTPSHTGLSFAESALKSATRRSNRGRQIDMNKELIVLMPGDDPREKLDLRNDAEWELFQTVMLEDYTGAISDGDTHGNHHPHSGSSHQPVSAHFNHNSISKAASKTDLSALAGSTSSISHMKSAPNETGVFETEAVLVPGVRLAAIDLASLTAQLRHQEALSSRYNTNVSVPLKPSTYGNKVNNKTVTCPVNYEDVSYYEIELDEEDEAVADALYARYILPKLSSFGNTNSNNSSSFNNNSNRGSSESLSVQGDGKIDTSASVRPGPGRPPKQTSTDSHLENEEKALLYGREPGGSRLAFRRVFSRLLSRLERELMYRETLLQQSPPLNEVLQQTSNLDSHNIANNLNNSHFNNTNNNSNASATSAVDVYVNQRHLQWLRNQTESQVRVCQAFSRQFHKSDNEKRKLPHLNKRKHYESPEHHVNMDVDETNERTNLDDVLQSLLHQDHLTLDALSLPANPNTQSNRIGLLTLSANRPTFPSSIRREVSTNTNSGTKNPTALPFKPTNVNHSGSDEEDDTISERFRALRSVTATQVSHLIGEEYALQLLCDLRPRMFPACPTLPTQEELALNKAILSHWACLRSHSKQSLLRAFHVFVMPLWCLPLRAVLPQPIDYPLTLLQTAYQRLQHIQQDLDRARLIVDRVRRREKLKKELVRQTSEQWQQAVLGEVVQGGEECLRVAEEVVRHAMSLSVNDEPQDNTTGPGHRSDTADHPNPINVTEPNIAVEEKRKRGRPRRIDSNQSTPQIKSLAGTPLVSQHSPKTNLTRDRFGKFLRKPSGRNHRNKSLGEEEDDDEVDEDDEDEDRGDICATQSDTEDIGTHEVLNEWKVPGSAKRLFTLRQWMPFTMKDVRDDVDPVASQTDHKHSAAHFDTDTDEDLVLATPKRETATHTNKKKKDVDMTDKKPSGDHSIPKKREETRSSSSIAKATLPDKKMPGMTTPASKSDKTEGMDSGVRTRHQQKMTPTPLRSSSRHKR